MKLRLVFGFSTQEVTDALRQQDRPPSSIVRGDAYVAFAYFSLLGTIQKTVCSQELASQHLARLPQVMRVMHILAEFFRATVDQRHLESSSFASDYDFSPMRKHYEVTMEIGVAPEHYKGAIQEEAPPEPAPVFKRRFRGGVLQ